MFLTCQYRVKDKSSRKKLVEISKKVNFVWNYCNETSRSAWKKNHKWLSNFDMTYLCAGSSKELGLNSAIIQLVACEHAIRRKQFKKIRLSWRSGKRNLGWIPLDRRCFKLQDDTLTFNGLTIKFWKHRELLGNVKTVSLTQTRTKKWFVNFACEVDEVPQLTQFNSPVGIDLGFKDVAVTSDGVIYSHPKPLRKYADKLAKAQRAKKPRQVAKIHETIKNVRKDYNHKISKEIVGDYDLIYVGDVSSKAMVKKGKGFAKSTLDASWGQLKTLLEYKSRRLGRVMKVVPERCSSLTCSVCFGKTGPSGLGGLGVRNWKCSGCGAEHDRDINAARNILRTGVGSYSPDGKPTKVGGTTQIQKQKVEKFLENGFKVVSKWDKEKQEKNEKQNG